MVLSITEDMKKRQDIEAKMYLLRQEKRLHRLTNPAVAKSTRYPFMHWLQPRTKLVVTLDRSCVLLEPSTTLVNQYNKGYRTWSSHLFRPMSQLRCDTYGENKRKQKKKPEVTDGGNTRVVMENINTCKYGGKKYGHPLEQKRTLCRGSDTNSKNQNILANTWSGSHRQNDDHKANATRKIVSLVFCRWHRQAEIDRHTAIMNPPHCCP